MTHQDPIRAPLRLLCSGLLLLSAACGPASSEAELAQPGELLGIEESALCSGLTVSSLVVNGVSGYYGEVSASGTWTVSTGANAVRLEYFLSGTLVTVEERIGSSGTWYFSYLDQYRQRSCGATGFSVNAYPMVIDSAGNRTTCTDSLKRVSTGFYGTC